MWYEWLTKHKGPEEWIFKVAAVFVVGMLLVIGLSV